MGADHGRLAYLKEANEIEFREYEVPSPETGAVLTEVKYANVCGSDIHTWKGKHPSRKSGAMGHEGVCRIVELGEGVETDYAGTPVEEGDLVAPVYFKTCQCCYPCQNGHFHGCVEGTARTVGSTDQWPHFTGTFATHYYIESDQYFYTIPEGLDPKIAATANCALSQVMFGIAEVGIERSDTVVIQGAGGLGLSAIAIVNEIGAESIVIEGRENRIQNAKAFQTDHVIDFTELETVEERANRVTELTDGTGADVAIEVTGVPDAFAEGPQLLGTRGRYLELGNVSPGYTTAFDPALLTRNSIDLVSRVRYNPWFLRRALTFLEETQETYPYETLLDQEFVLGELKRALKQSEERNVGRAVLTLE